MNRIIKFRAWDKVSKSMYFLDRENYMDKLIEDENWKPMQFTGLHDKNGKEIYEGDIVKDGMDDIYSVEWGYAGSDLDNKARCYVLMPVASDGDIWQLSPNEAKELEVIGNIHENPELLQVKE